MDAFQVLGDIAVPVEGRKGSQPELIGIQLHLNRSSAQMPWYSAKIFDSLRITSEPSLRQQPTFSFAKSRCFYINF